MLSVTEKFSLFRESFFCLWRARKKSQKNIANEKIISNFAFANGSRAPSAHGNNRESGANPGQCLLL
jgi:hypothetical protein